MAPQASFTASTAVEGALAGAGGRPLGDQHGDGDDDDEGQHPAEHEADALEHAAIGRQQQDHRAERDRLEVDDQPDQEEIEEHASAALPVRP